jgi:hypothetical protein
MNSMKGFYPFEASLRSSANDFQDLIDSLDLDKARLSLLWQLLRRFEIAVWFNDDDDDGNGIDPGIEIATFWDHNHVASVQLTELLEHIVTFDNDIGLDKEIVALTKFKDLIEKAIASRQQQQPEVAA